MAKITLNLGELREMLGYDISEEELGRTLPMLGCDIDSIDDEIKVEFFPSRPDLYSLEGVSRALKAFISIEEGPREYYTGDGGVKLEIDPSVLDIRPIMLSGVIRDIDITEEMVKSMMNLQEKLHLTIGRNRAKVSIGLHDLDTVKPPFRYKAVVPTEAEFEALQMEGEYLNLDEILRRHPKGRDYANILEGKPLYPLFVDAEENVLSFPPIINAATTTVTSSTRNILMDVTGLDFNAVAQCLNIVLCDLADRGGSLETVKLIIPEHGKKYYRGAKKIGGRLELETPDMSPGSIKVDPDYVRKIIGLDLKSREIEIALKKMGMDLKKKGEELEVRYPPYRGDILHPVDVVEDIAIGLGYEKIETTLPETMTFGTLNPGHSHYKGMKELALGLGYTEVKTLTLTNEERCFKLMSLPYDKYGEEVTALKNPLTSQNTICRTHLIPSLVEIFALNKKRGLPQRIFEIGDVVIKGDNKPRMALAAIHPKASFTEAKSMTEALLNALSITDYQLQEKGPYSEMFITGRYARIEAGEEDIGYFGEIHPSCLESWELGAQVIAAEIDLAAILGILAEAG